MGEKFDNSNMHQDEQVLTNLLFEFANCIDIMVWRLEELFSSRGRTLSHKYKKAFNNTIDLLKKLKTNYDIAFSPAINDQGLKNFDQMLKDSNDIIRLFLLIYDRCADDNTTINKIEEIVTSIKSTGFVPEDLYDKFKLKH